MQTTEFNVPLDRYAGFECVTWLDSCGLSAGWQALEDVDPRPVTIASVGLVLAEDELAITLAPHVGYHGEKRNQVGGALTIPKAAIVQRAPMAISASCCGPASEQTQPPTSPPSWTSDPEGSSKPSTRPSATCARSSVASS